MTNNTGVEKQPVQNENAIVVNQIIVRSIDRTMKDIATWRQGHIAAERPLWPVRTRLYNLYSDVELDGHLTGLVQKRFSAVLNKKLFFKNSKNEKVEAMDALIKSKAFRKYRELILHTQLWGTSGAEFIPGKEFEWVEIPRKHIKPEHKIIALEENGFTGVEYEKLGNIIITGETNDLGLYLKCCPYALWKRGGLADYAQFVEIFGQPVRIFEYDAFDQKTKDEVQKVANSAGGAMILTIPKQANFKMEDGKTANANGDLQTQFIKMLNDELSVIMLGNTETTTSSSNSGYAQSKTHDRQQLEITKADMEYELQYLNSPQFLSVLKIYNFEEEGEFAHEQEADVNILKERIMVDKVLAGIVPIDDDYFYDTYDVPKPKDYEAMKAKMEEDKRKGQAPAPEDTDDPVPSKKKAPVKNGDPGASAEEKKWWEKLTATLSGFFG